MLAQRQGFLKFKYTVLKEGSSLRVEYGDSFLGIPDSDLLYVALVISFKGNSPKHFFVCEKTSGFVHAVSTV